MEGWAGEMLRSLFLIWSELFQGHKDVMYTVLGRELWLDGVCKIKLLYVGHFSLLLSGHLQSIRPPSPDITTHYVNDS